MTVVIAPAQGDKQMARPTVGHRLDHTLPRAQAPNPWSRLKTSRTHRGRAQQRQHSEKLSIGKANKQINKAQSMASSSQKRRIRAQDAQSGRVHSSSLNPEFVNISQAVFV